MSRASLIIFGMLLLGSCRTEVVELLPESGAPRDVGGEVAPADSARESARDRRADQPAPDSKSACVCRAKCRDTPECQQYIGPSSTCQGLICTGAKGTCTIDANCGGTLWFCAAGPTAVTACP